MRNLLEQLNKCHRENIIHSNIKAENIKICQQNDKAILIDFALDNIKLKDKITPFTAPEIIN
jgi:serine/threonine protein kinase